MFSVESSMFLKFHTVGMVYAIRNLQEFKLEDKHSLLERVRHGLASVSTSMVVWGVTSGHGSTLAHACSAGSYW